MKQKVNKVKHFRKNEESRSSFGNNKSFNDEVPFCVGIKPLRELLELAPDRIEWVYLRKGQKNLDSQKILDLCTEHEIRFTLINEDEIKRILPSRYKVNIQGAFAKLKEVSTVSYEDLLINATNAPLPLLVVLDSVQDPGNIGTLARSLYALGGAGLVLPLHNSANLGLGAKKSAAGALDFLPVTKVTNLARALEDAKQAGYVIYSTHIKENFTENEEENNLEGINSTKTKNSMKKNQEIPLLNPFFDKLEFPAVLVLGAEDKGIRPNVHKRCDYTLKIPMLRDFDSLNVAQAGGILISAFLKNILENK